MVLLNQMESILLRLNDEEWAQGKGRAAQRAPFDMVLSSNSRSAEIPDTMGVTRSAFIEVGVLGSLRAIHWD